MPSNLSLFIILVAGFVFLSWFTLTYYISATWDGPRLVLWSGLCGGLLFFLSRLIILGIQGWGFAPARLWSSGFEHELVKTVGVILPEAGPFVGSLGGTVALALLLPLLLNLAYRIAVPGRREAEFAVWRARKSIDDELLLLLVNQIGTGRAIAFSMADSKVYVGFVLAHPGLKRPGRSGEKRFFSILPILSGYRDRETRQLRLTTNYASLLRAISEGQDPIISGYSLSDLRVLLPIDEVQSARMFDEEIFRRLFHEEVPRPHAAS
ncbi:MAG: hypothetical protein ACRELU_04015 [Gemmatimonadota bacterium]